MLNFFKYTIKENSHVQGPRVVSRWGSVTGMLAVFRNFVLITQLFKLQADFCRLISCSYTRLLSR